MVNRKLEKDCDKMDTYRNNAIIVGVLFISATVFSILSSVFLGSTLASPISLVTVHANENQVMIAVILQLIAALSAFGTAVFIYPILKKFIESLAIAYVGLRLLENTFYILGVVSLITLLTLSQESAGAIASYQPLSNLLIALYHWAGALGTVIIAGMGGITLNYVLYQSKLVPRWLSGWGLIGDVLLILFGLIGLTSLQPSSPNSILALLAIPLAVQEMVFAVWLIIKGFNQSAIASEKPKSSIS
jgi:Domain of unknown function (DUF4386)